MGRDFKNEFSWSTSRDRLFQRCRRAYYWRYYAHWGGWGRDATDEQRIAYRLGKQDSFATWGGTIVHDVIEDAIKALIQRGTPIELDALKADARARLRTGWVQSRDGHWARDPKRNVQLWEHYYGDEDSRRPERTKRVADTVYTALEGFVAGPFPELIARTPREAFLNIEILDTIQIDGAKVYVKPDLAFRHPDHGDVWLVDWKTGTPKEVDDFQVRTYALWARTKHGVEPAQVRGVLVYLARGEQKDFGVDEEGLAAAEQRIRESLGGMRSSLRDPDNNVGDLADFPMADDDSVCRWCNFRQLCFGRAGVPGAEQAGDAYP